LENLPDKIFGKNSPDEIVSQVMEEALKEH